MNIYELLDWYSKCVKSDGEDKAKKALWDLGYNRTLTMLIPMLFNNKGEVINLPSLN